jgi:hypothetical protein
MNYLEMLPLSGIAKYAKGHPNDGVPFSGYPRVHPSEKNKIILVNDPLGPNPTVLEFKLEDIIFVDEIPSAVTEAGEGIPMVKLWVKRGAVGMILEPFEVNDPVQFTNKVHELKERVRQNRPQASQC